MEEARSVMRALKEERDEIRSQLSTIQVRPRLIGTSACLPSESTSRVAVLVEEREGWVAVGLRGRGGISVEFSWMLVLRY